MSDEANTTTTVTKEEGQDMKGQSEGVVDVKGGEGKAEGAMKTTAPTTTTQPTTEDTQSTCSTASASPSDTSTSSSEGGTGSPSTQEASRAINIEDSDRKYVVIEPNKPKTWLAAYNSLAPRTRQTIRTAVIAVISALALVAIFHLARLAEHPVSENAIDGPSKKEQMQLHQQVQQQQQEEEERREEEAWIADGVLKAHSGKAVSPMDTDDENWQRAKEIAEEMAAAVGAEGADSPIQDILARSRPASRRLRPILNVPVGVDHDIQRTRSFNRALSRPANATEVNKTLATVRFKVEADRKKLSSKSLRLWSSGDVPLRVLLVTTWRSGSTFLGQVLANHPAVFNHYEPFSPLGVRQVRSGREAFQSQQLLHRLLDCQYEGQNEYLNFTRAHPEDMIGHNKVIWDACRRGPNMNACFNATFLSQACQMFPIQLVKTVRLRLNLTQLFLNDERMNVKVVFLVRDPRGTMSSRYSSVSWCNDSQDCSSPEVLCSDLQGDLKVATALRQLYPDRFKMIKYEDLASNPQNEIRDLMDFLGMEYSRETAQFVQENTEQDLNSPWSIKRKSADRVSLWKKQLPLQEIHTIQNACESVLKTLQYELVGQ